MFNNLKYILFVLMFCFLQSSCSLQDTQPLQSQPLDSSWVFYQQGTEMRYPAEVPGVVHLDLFDNNLIPDPFAGTNEDSLQWIEGQNWIYETTFDTDLDVWKKEHIEFHFEGLDTYATVFLNDSLILEADNMFRSWDVNVKSGLKQRENHLKIVFTSPLLKNKEKYESAEYELPSGNELVDIKVGPYTRKAPYHFGWDWGPRFVTSGIWKPIEIRAWNTSRLLDVYSYTESFSETSAFQKVQIEIQSDTLEEAEMEVRINGIKHVFTSVPGKQIVTFDYEIENPKLWWPNGKGNADLYDLDVEIYSDGRLLDADYSKFGVRSAYLHQEQDTIGKAFYFEINGEDIFAKGANYIPQDMFLPRVKDSQYRELLVKAKEANINMLRVWGGGIYENDIFYELCDSLGIMVWQDFMFAGSLYPDDVEFMQNVEKEVEDNVKRLRGHPSLVLWCGNNEIEVAMENWGWEGKFDYTPEQQDNIRANYYTLFDHLIPRTLEKFDLQTPYVHTSPLSNWGTPENFNNSTMHYWGVWHGPDDFKGYKNNVGRFMVEYGFQSFPSYDLLSKYIDSSEMKLDSETMTKRQKSYIGNGMIQKHSDKLFGKSENFKEFIINSQKTQAEAMKIAIRSHRLNYGHCMGTLFWQWNDCWPGPSWSAIQYDGENKLLYKEVKKWYSETIAWLEEENGIVTLNLCSDSPTENKIKVDILIESGKKGRYLDQIEVVLDQNTKQILLDSKELSKLIKGNKKRQKSYSLRLSASGKDFFSTSDKF